MVGISWLDELLSLAARLYVKWSLVWVLLQCPNMIRIPDVQSGRSFVDYEFWFGYRDLKFQAMMSSHCWMVFLKCCLEFVATITVGGKCWLRKLSMTKIHRVFISSLFYFLVLRCSRISSFWLWLPWYWATPIFAVDTVQSAFLGYRRHLCYR